MIPDAEIAAARAALPGVLPTTLKRVGHLLVGLCPVHQEKTPSFYVYPDDWHFHCFSCGVHGDAITWLRDTKGLAFPDAVRQLVGGVQVKSLSSPATKKAPRETEVPSLVLDLWRAATAPRLASMYLETRGIPQKALPAALRGHERVWCKEAGEYRPAMLAAITDAADRITAIQRTYLEDRLTYDGQTNFKKGARCPDLSAGKKSLGPLGSGAVKLAAAGADLGLSEGIESGLAAARLFRWPVWVACGLARFGMPAHLDKHGHPVPERPPSIHIPAGTRRLIFFADNGDLAHQVADYACSWWRRQGLAAQAEYPDDRHDDWGEAVLS